MSLTHRFMALTLHVAMSWRGTTALPTFVVGCADAPPRRNDDSFDAAALDATDATDTIDNTTPDTPDSLAGEDAIDAAPGEWVDRLVAVSIPAPGDHEGSFFGDAIALDGNRLAVGWPRAWVGELFEAGAAYVFARDGGNWSTELSLAADIPAAYGTFGSRVAISGPSLFVAADGTLVYTRESGTWSRVGAFEWGGNFAIAGDHAIVIRSPGSVWGGDCGSLRREMVFLERVSGTWAPAVSLSGGDCNFAVAAALDGDRAVRLDGMMDGVAPTVMFFVRSETAWLDDTMVALPAPSAHDTPPTVDIDGDIAAVGWPADGGQHEGVVYLLEREASGWRHEATLTAPDATDFDYFGWSVSVSAGVVFIGAPSSTYSSNYHPGHVYAFQKVDGAWREVLRLARDEPDDQFGFAVAASWPSFAVAQPKGGNGQRGVVWIYTVR